MCSQLQSLCDSFSKHFKIFALIDDYIQSVLSLSLIERLYTATRVFLHIPEIIQ